MWFNVTPPKFDNDNINIEAFDRFVIQFDRYISITEPPESKKLNIFLLCVGDKATISYDDMIWTNLKAGISEYSRAINFFRKNYLADKNVLCERIKFLSNLSTTVTINSRICE